VRSRQPSRKRSNFRNGRLEMKAAWPLSIANALCRIIQQVEGRPEKLPRIRVKSSSLLITGKISSTDRHVGRG
jgi:hypothetical protein